MANLTIAAADVLYITGTTVSKNAGVAIVAGQVIYIDGSNLFQLGIVSSSITPYMALNGGVAGQPITAIATGTVDIGTALVQGLPLFVSPTAGSVSDAIADIVSPNYVNVLGYPSTTANYLIISPYLIPNPLTV